MPVQKCLMWVVSGISFVPLVVIIIAVAVPVWEETKVDETLTTTITTHTYTGLWSTCTYKEVKDESTLDCDASTEWSDSLKTTQAMLLIGLISCGGVVVLTFIRCCCFSESKLIGYGIIGLALFSAISLFIGAIVFSEDVAGSLEDLHVGFGLTIVGGVLMVLIALIVVLAFCFFD